MKTGKSLVELAKALEDIKEKSRDLMVPVAHMQMGADATLQVLGEKKAPPGLAVDLEGRPAGMAVPTVLYPTDYSMGQIYGYAGVPAAYGKKILAENPSLLAANVNHGFNVKQAENPAEARMLRTYDGKVRAMLSSRYRRLDCYDLCQATLPTLLENAVEVVSSEITDTRMYIKALTPRVQAEIKKGDVVQYGLVISNSDVGAGSVRIEPLIYRLVCLNGMIGETSIRKMHIGRDMAADNVQELLTDATLALTDQAFWAQVNDIVKASMSPEIFERNVARLREAANTPIKNFDIPDVVDMTMRAVGIDGEGAKNSIVAYLANGADGAGLTQWGLINGFTFAAQDEKIGYDRSIELERAGAKVLEIDPRKWSRIAEAA